MTIDAIARAGLVHVHVPQISTIQEGATLIRLAAFPLLETEAEAESSSADGVRGVEAIVPVRENIRGVVLVKSGKTIVEGAAPVRMVGMRIMLVAVTRIDRPLLSAEGVVHHRHVRAQSRTVIFERAVKSLDTTVMRVLLLPNHHLDRQAEIQMTQKRELLALQPCLPTPSA